VIHQQIPTAQPLRAYLMRELLLDPQGQPMTEDGPSDDPDAMGAHWELCDEIFDERGATLVPICEGELIIVSADDTEFLRQYVSTEIGGSQNAIRAIFRPTTAAPPSLSPATPRMADLLVVPVAAGTSLCWEVGPGHDDIPDVLTVPGELCLVLREDLGLILHDPTDPSSLPTASLLHAHGAKESTRAII
jgi:hypothetical protein